MKRAKIKASAEGLIIGYNNSAAPLGARTDHNELAIIAHESGRQDYKDLFEVLPSLEELKEAKLDAALGIAPVVKPLPTPQQAAGANLSGNTALPGRTPLSEVKE